MFEFPAGISFIIDSLILLLYFNSPWIYNKSINITLNDLNPLNSIFIFIILSGLRIIVFLPYVWLYQNDNRLVLAQVPYLWHSFNFILLLIKSCWELSHQSWNMYVWYILLGSTISVCFQTICLRHLISTALPERHIILGITRNNNNNNNNNDKKNLNSINNDENSNDNNNENNSNNSNNDTDNNDIIHAIRVSIQDVRQEWNRKVEKLANTFSELKISSGFGENKSDETMVFEQLLILFTQSQPQSKSLLSSTQSSPDIVISNITRLYYIYPNIVEFYIPQLLVFLLYGSFDVTSLLQNALFEMCESSITFAHRLHWFIVAFCLSGAGVGPEGVAILHQLLKEIESHGIISSQRFLLTLSSTSSSTTTTTTSTTPPPLTGLGKNIGIEKDEFKYNQQHYQYNQYNQLLPISATTHHDLGEGEEKLALLHSEYGQNKPTSILSSTYFKSIILEKCVPLPNNLNEFTSTIAFWESLCDLSLHLGSLPREVRTEQMRINLQPIKEKYLPSLTIYSPVSGNIPHRIWGIQIEESFAFSTKERAPMLLCLEIIEFYDYHQPINQRSTDKSGTSWLNEIKDGIKRAFLPQSEESKVSIEHDNEHDIEHGLNEHEILGDGSDSSYIRSAGSFQQPLTFVSDIGQWSESSPIKLRTRASFDSYYSYNKNSNNNSYSNNTTPRKSLAIPLRSGQVENLNVKNINNESKIENINTLKNDTSNITTIDSSGNNINPITPTIENNRFIRNSNISVDDDPGVSLDKYGNADPIVVFKERWSVKEKRIKATSPIGHLPGYKLVPVIVKSNDDLRQEQCAGQLIFQMYHILKSGGIDCWLKPYTILALSPTSGLLEAIPDTISFDVLRRRMPEYTTLKNFFESFFGEEETESYEIARNNFIKSLSAYCIVCYILQIKDRHNGNILLDRFGHIIHIDFGFILGSTPGGNIGFESAPFKLTAEMVELMGGIRSPYFHRFRDLCVKVFMELRKYHHKIVLLLEMLSVGNEHLPFFLGNPQRTIDQLRKRFRPEVHDQAAIDHVHHLINLATDNWTTTCYDRYQRCCVGVL